MGSHVKQMLYILVATNTTSCMRWRTPPKRPNDFSSILGFIFHNLLSPSFVYLLGKKKMLLRVEIMSNIADITILTIIHNT